MDHKTIPELFEHVIRQYGDTPAYRSKINGEWVLVDWNEARRRVRAITRGLAGCGIKPGDRISILSGTRLEWVLADFAAVCGGVVTVGIYHTNLPKDCAYIMNHSESRLIFVEDADQLAKVLEVRQNLSTIETIVIFDGPSDEAKGVLSFDDFIQRGSRVDESVIDERAAGVKPEDLASLVYTSGTTGVPKGAMITHKNLIFTSWSVSESIKNDPSYETLLFLPLAHVFARLIVYACFRTGMSTAFAEDITLIGENLKEIRPDFIASVPRIFEKVNGKILTGVEQAGGVKKMLFDWSLGVGYEVSRLQQAGQPVTGLLAVKHRIADKLVLHKIRAALGGRMLYAISGAAPLNKAIAEFFHACGILILEGIGMTENTSFSHVNRIDHYKFGTVGQAGPGIETKLLADGEILYRGDNVMAGYYRSPEETAKTIDPDGWLQSGDIGTIDDEGFLSITDRKKDLIITAGGKNIAPQRIEKLVRTARIVGQVVAIGDRRKFVSALITLDPDEAPVWATENGIQDISLSALAGDPKIFTEVQRAVDAANHELASYETIKLFTILPRDFSIDSGELTPTLKVKRKVVSDKYAAEVDAMYEE
jgi:long-chain acyl-CoA synthetase